MRMIMTGNDSIRRSCLSGLSVLIAIVAVTFMTSAARGQEPLSEHGWAADGHKTDSQMPDGANLRDTKLNRSGLITAIKCGRLNSQMPAFDKFAYSDGRCYGKTQADLKSYPTRMPDPPATLQQREIELIADFLLVKVVGKGPMDRKKCIDFWGSDTDVCKEFPK
jgi:hypothetical protein